VKEKQEEVVEINPIVENLSNSELARISSSMNLSMLNYMQRYRIIIDIRT